MPFGINKKLRFTIFLVKLIVTLFIVGTITNYFIIKFLFKTDHLVLGSVLISLMSLLSLVAFGILVATIPPFRNFIDCNETPATGESGE